MRSIGLGRINPCRPTDRPVNKPHEIETSPLDRETCEIHVGDNSVGFVSLCCGFGYRGCAFDPQAPRLDGDRRLAQASGLMRITAAAG